MNKIKLNNRTDFEISSLKASNEAARAGKTKEAKAGDATRNSTSEINFSDRAAIVGKLIEDLKTAPDVRQEKVAALREAIERGDYQPRSEDIADAIFRDEK